MSTQSHAHTRCGTLRKSSISTRGMLKFTYKGRFLTIKIAYEKFLDWKSERWKHALVPLLYIELFFWKKLKSWFLVEFQSFVFGQILAVLGRIWCIDSGWELALNPRSGYKRACNMGYCIESQDLAQPPRLQGLTW
jgi:hypothetical protein